MRHPIRSLKWQVQTLATAAIFMGACNTDRVETVAPQQPRLIIDARPEVVLRDAIAYRPADLGTILLWGVLDADQTESQRTVAYVTLLNTRVYRFQWEKGAWQPLRELSRSQHGDSTNRVASGGNLDLVSPYTDSLAKVWHYSPPSGTVLKQLINGTFVTYTGWWNGVVTDSGPGNDSSLNYAEAYPASKRVGATDYSFPQDSMTWYYRLRSDPTHERSCLKSQRVCSFPDNNGLSALAWLAYLHFYARVVDTVISTITSGPTNLPQAGSYTWTATASGGDVASPFTYKWEYSEDSVTWVTKSTTTSFTQTFNNPNQLPFWLRFTATSGGRSGKAFRHVTVASPLLYPLNVYISGQQYITLHQSAQYTANTSGGLAPYTYKWRSRDGWNWSFGAWSSWYSTGSVNYTFASINACRLNQKELQVQVTDALSHTVTSTSYEIFITNPC